MKVTPYIKILEQEFLQSFKQKLQDETLTWFHLENEYQKAKFHFKRVQSSTMEKVKNLWFAEILEALENGEEPKVADLETRNFIQNYYKR